jgi:hypothetical protein
MDKLKYLLMPFVTHFKEGKLSVCKEVYSIAEPAKKNNTKVASEKLVFF